MSAEAIKIASGSDDKPTALTVYPIRRYGVWALHFTASADGCSVTHVPSGRLVFAHRDSVIATSVFDALSLVFPAFWSGAGFAETTPPKAERDQWRAIGEVCSRAVQRSAPAQEQASADVAQGDA